MRISLEKDPESQPGEILAHVQVSALDDPPEFAYSHSFRYIVPSGKEGEIIVYTDKIAASSGVNGARYPFDLEKCRNKDCKNRECPVIADKGHRLLVADIFHTQPTPEALRYFGIALFKALFSSNTEQLLQEIKTTSSNGRVLLQLNNHDDLDAIPWEYAKDPTTFLVHQCKFARICDRQQDPLPKLPLRIVTVVPDPVIPHGDPNADLPELHLGDQWQKFIDVHNANKKRVILDRVFPPTVKRMDALVVSQPETATVLHFMGHCVSKDDTRVLMFEHPATGFQFVDAQRPNTKHLQLAFLSACNTRNIARVMLKRGVPYTIGSHCPIPNDLAREFESEFYKFLAGGFTVEEAMWRARVSFQNQDRKDDYFSGAMILYSSLFTQDNGFECDEGVPSINPYMPPNNLELIAPTPTFCGRKKELVELNSILRDTVEHKEETYRLYTIVGISGQGKTALAVEAVRRGAHFFPGGIFVWKFDQNPISLIEYLEKLAKAIFPDKLNSNGDVKELRLDVLKAFFKHPSCLLILDHADTLKFAAEVQRESNAVALNAWLEELTSTPDIAVKILATSQEGLGWSGEKVIPLDGFTGSDIHSGCKLFVQSLSPKAKAKIEEEEDSKPLLRELVKRLDGHPLGLKLLGSAASLPKYLDKSLKEIVYEHYDTMLADDDLICERLEDCFGPTINSLSKEQRLVLHLCCLFTGPITNGILLFVSHFIDRFEPSEESVFDFSPEIIASQLRSLCDRELLTSTKEDSYHIHIALREALRHRKMDLCLRLHLQIPGKYDDVFIIGVKTSSTLLKSAVLEWLFNDMKSNPTSRLMNQKFGVQYYSIGNAPHNIVIPDNNNHDSAKAPVKHVLPVQLIVFICKSSEILHKNLDMFCKEQITPVVVEKKLPFIVCLDHSGATTQKVDIITQMKRLANTLQESLEGTHKIVRTEVPSGKSFADPFSASISNVSLKNKTSVYQKSLTDIQMDGNFVGRKKELGELDKLLNDNTHKYITIKGFGGMGKTSLALQAAKNFNGRILALSLVGIPTLSSVVMKIARFVGIDTKELSPQEQQSTVIEKLEGDETILLYLDNMEDIKNATGKGNLEAKALMKLFQRMPQNVKILATSRETLGFPDEKIVELDGLTEEDGMQVFRQWVPQRNDEVDNRNAMELSRLVRGHSLSLRLLGGMFNNCKESISQFVENVFDRLPKAINDNSLDDRHESIEACIKYSFDNLEPALGSLLGQLKAFEIPFTKKLAVLALTYETLPVSSWSMADALHKLWQLGWLDQRPFEVEPMLGDWRSRIIEEEREFYGLHPRLRDFLNKQFKDVEVNPDMFKNCEIQFYTALCYGVGFGVVSNLEKQIEWCIKAADNNHLEAQLILAECYETGGGGVNEDQEKAFYWYLMAAKAGDKEAQWKVIHCYNKGNGVEKDFDKGYSWEEKYDNNKTEPLIIKFNFSEPFIHRATEYNHIDLVRSLMDQSSATVNIKDRNGRTPLHVAAEKGHLDILKLLAFEFGADTNAKMENGMTPLHVAAENEHIDIVRLLVTELGADVWAKDKNDRTLLHVAMEINVFRFLVTEMGDDVDANAEDKEGLTPLHCAAKNGRIDIINMLMAELGADKDKKDYYGGTLLHYAAEGGVMSLLETDVNPEDDCGRSLLHWAVQGGQREITRFVMLKWPLTELEFESNKIGDKGAIAIAESLKQNTTLTKLNIKRNDISDEGALAIAKSLKNTALIELNLEDNKIHNEGACALAESLMQNTTLVKLNLTWNKIGDKGAFTIAELIKQNTLTELGLGADIGIEGACAIAQALKQNTTLVRLNLDRNSPCAEGARALAESLKQNTTLTELGLDWNTIDVEGVCAIAESLKQNTTLTELNLGGVGKSIGIVGTRAIAEFLMQNTAVTTLDISSLGDNCGIEGAHAIAESLKQNTTLTKLNLEENNVGVEGARVLAESLKQNTTLTSLSLFKNDIGVEGVCVLAEFLKQNTTLTVLSLGGNKCGVEGARAIAESLKQNTTLTELSFGENNIGAEGARVLAESLRQNKTLTNLSLDENNIGVEGARAIAESLKQNTTLNELNLRDNDMGVEGARTMMGSLKQNMTLTEVNLEEESVGAKGAHTLFNTLNRNKALKELVKNMDFSVTKFEAEANVYDNNGGAPLHMVELCKILTEFWKNSNANGGLTPLHIIVAYRHTELQFLAAKFGTHADSHDNNGWTPLHIAAVRGFGEVIKLLVTNFGANPNAKDNDGRTPLHRAADNGHVEVVRLLMAEYIVDANAKDDYGQTPLHLAAQYGCIETVKLLVTEFGADVNAKDNKRLTPLHLASKEKHIDVAKLLLGESKI